MREHAATRAAFAGDVESPWLKPAPDWDPCVTCDIRSACREVRECYDDMPPPPPDLKLRVVEPPDIVA
jgi:hypothetical protein